MDELLLSQQREAGERLFAACEAGLGVEGPAALARLTSRSKTWWSRLRSGKGSGIPGWPELESILPTDLGPTARAELRACHQEQWLRVHDIEMYGRLCCPTLAVIPQELLHATHQAAVWAAHLGRYREALDTLKLVELACQAQSGSQPAPATLALLGHSLQGQSMCWLHLMEKSSGIAPAARAAECFREAKAWEGEAFAIHQLGLAQYQTGRYQEAIVQFDAANRRYERLGRKADQLRVARDRSHVLIKQRCPLEAERLVLATLREALQVEPREVFLALLYLVDTSIHLQDATRVRHWHEKANEYARRRRSQLGELLHWRYLVVRRQGHALALARLERHRPHRTDPPDG